LGMRGSDERTGSLFSFVDLEERVPHRPANLSAHSDCGHPVEAILDRDLASRHSVGQQAGKNVRYPVCAGIIFDGHNSSPGTDFASAEVSALNHLCAHVQLYFVVPGTVVTIRSRSAPSRRGQLP
jgi:hypothetical protein